VTPRCARHSVKRGSVRVFVALVLFVASAASVAQVIESAREIIISPPIAVMPTTRDGWDKSTPEKSYFGVYAANKSGDEAWIVETFVPTERESVARNVHDAQLLAANTAVFAAIAGETIQKRVEYGNYVILVIEARRTDGRRYLRNIPFKSVDRAWLVTNELAADKVFLGLKSGYVDQ
jgi:hypothetical protein